MKKTFHLYVIIAFLLGFIACDFAYALKVPNNALPDSIPPELSDMITNYIVPILNNAKYQARVSPTEIFAADELNEGEFLLETSGVTKRFIISDGVKNYYVNLTDM